MGHLALPRLFQCSYFGSLKVSSYNRFLPHTRLLASRLERYAQVVIKCQLRTSVVKYQPFDDLVTVPYTVGKFEKQLR
jgi:hypothetical protein